MNLRKLTGTVALAPVSRIGTNTYTYPETENVTSRKMVR
jgi:hypothetical protein